MYTNEEKGINYAIFGVLALLIALPAFFRGMFFEYEQFILYLVSFSFFIFSTQYLLGKKGTFTLTSPLDISILLLFLGYAISSFFAISIRNHVLELLKYMEYFVVFYLVRQYAEEGFYRKILLNGIFLSAVAVSAIGILNAVGLLHNNGGYSVAERWINSTLQYHNAFAAYLLCGLILGYALYLGSKNGLAKAGYVLGGYALLLGFVFSYSRGAWLLFPVAVLGMIVLGFRYFPRILAYTLQIAVPFALAGNRFWAGVLARDAANPDQTTVVFSWAPMKWFLLGLLFALLAVLAAYGIRLLIERTRYSQMAFSLGLIALVAAAAIVLGIAAPSLVSSVLPQTLIERVANISLNADTARERFVFYYDAMGMVKDYPVFGAGGGAWKVAYQMYQSYLYYSNQAHSYLMQVWLETGTIGFLFFLFLVVSILFSSFAAWKKYRRDNENGPLMIGTIMAILILLGHSMIDFDFSLMGVTIVFWALNGILASAAEVSGIKLRISKLIVYPLVGLALLFSLSALIGNGYIEKGVAASEKKDYTVAYQNFELAKKFDFLYSDLKIDYARSRALALSEQNKLSKIVLERLTREAEYAYRYDRYSSETLTRMIAYYFAVNQPDEAFEYFRKAIDCNPLQPSIYKNYASALIDFSNQGIDAKDYATAKKYLVKISEIESIVAEKGQGKLKPLELDEETLNMVQYAKDMAAKIKD